MVSRFIAYGKLLLEVYFQNCTSVTCDGSAEDIWHVRFIEYIACPGRGLIFSCYCYRCRSCSLSLRSFICCCRVCSICFALVVVFYCILCILVCCPLRCIYCISCYLICYFRCPACKCIACISCRCSVKARCCCIIIQTACCLGCKRSLASRCIGYAELLLEVYLQYKVSFSADRSFQYIGCCCIKHIACFGRFFIFGGYLYFCICPSTSCYRAFCSSISPVCLVIVLYCILCILVCCPLCHITYICGYSFCYCRGPAAKCIACFSCLFSVELRCRCSIVQTTCCLFIKCSMVSRFIAYCELFLEVHLQDCTSVTCYGSAKDIWCVRFIEYIACSCRDFICIRYTCCCCSCSLSLGCSICRCRVCSICFALVIVLYLITGICYRCPICS